jgi:hypothetical protein
MLKISIVLVTTTAFAALLIAYPFSPHPAAQASGDVAQVATATLPKEARPTALQPDAAPVGIAALLPDAAQASDGTEKPLPVRTGPVASDPAAGRADAPTRPTRLDPDRPVDPRIPPRPSRPERQGVHSAAVPVTSAGRGEFLARPGALRWDMPVASAARYPAYTGRIPAYVPSGLARHGSGGRTSARQTHRTPRYRSLALAPDQPIR